MKSVLDWFIKNPVAANLLMAIILIGGVVGVKFINNEFFPNIEPLFVQVSVPYPGAGPLEVEEQICIKIEEAISDIEGISKVKSTASQGVGQVLIEGVDGWSLQWLINDVKNRVDAISTFPVNAEKPVVRDFTVRKEVATLVVSGGDDESAIKELSQQLKDSLTRVPGVSQVDLGGIRNYEVSVEVPEAVLRAYGLNFDDIARAIRESSLNLPAGQMHNPDGDIQIQVYGQGYQASDFENIVVVKNVDGSQVLLGQIATIKDSFEEKNFLSEYDGKVAAKLVVKVGDNPDTIGTAKEVKAFLKTYEMPPGYKVTIWSDQSYYLKDRLQILASNSAQGLVLVFVLLLLFLRPALAIWVTAGIAVAYLGTIMVMPMTSTTINVVSTFSFLLILGIVVDDAIVVSENIYSNYEKGLPGPTASSMGVNGVAKPVVLAVITTLLVFFPMLFIPGKMTKVFEPIPVVAMIALSFSLIEALLILPSHLSHLKPEKKATSFIGKNIFRLRMFFTGGLKKFSVVVYQPILDKSLAHQGAAIATFFSILMICLSLLVGGWLKFSPMPNFENESVTAQVTMQEGVGFGRLLDVQKQVEDGLDQLRDHPKARNYDGSSAVLNSFTSVDNNQVTFEVNLSSNDDRKITTKQMLAIWRETIGEIYGVESLLLTTTGFGVEKDITLRLAGSDIEVLQQATEELKARLSAYAGVHDVNDSLSSARQEIRIALKPHGELLGLSLADVANQVRHAFYGAEAQRIPRLREDVKVMVRYPRANRATIESLVNMRIKLADGTLIPFAEVAEATFIPGYTTIIRTDRERVVDVFADAIPGVANATEIVQLVMRNDLPVIVEKYPGVSFLLDGKQMDLVQMLDALMIGLFFVMLAIYALLAVEFKSYLQPFYVLSAIPFGIAGAIIGHLLLGMNFSIPSAFGVMATAGVVVNSNLVLIDRIETLRMQGASIIDAVQQGAQERLRPILLTSLTTFFGLMPILMEESPSAATLIPLVVSLSFGVVFATTITLLMVPALYTFFETSKQRLGFKHGTSVEIQEVY